jgi:hypothetical protein
MTEPTKTPHVGNSSVPEVAEFMRQSRIDSKKAYAEDMKVMLRLGAITRDTDAGDAFLLHRNFGGVIPFNRQDDALAYVSELSQAERIVLRDRILGVAEFPSAETAQG